MTQAEKLLTKEVNDNLKFLLKVKPMSEKDIKDFIILCLGMRVNINEWPWNKELVNKIVNIVYNNLEISK
jgi:hypothetical protein